MFDACSSQSPIITVNQRLAQYCRERWLANSKQAVHEAAIFSLSEWQQLSWERCLISGMVLPSVLSPFAEQQLWQTALEVQCDGPSGLQAIQLLQSSYQLISDYRLEPASWPTPLPELAEWSLPCFKHFEALCQERQVIPAYQMGAVLANHIQLLSDINIKHITFLGFAYPTPQLQHYQAQLQAQGITHDFTQLPTRDSEQIDLVYTKTAEDELNAAASWANQQRQNNPSARIAIVVPDLHLRYQQVETQLKTVIEPEQLLFPDISQSKISMAGGQTLMAYPVVQCGYQILALEQLNSLEQLGAVLLSPFINVETDYEQRIKIEVALRARLPEQTSYYYWKKTLQQYFEDSDWTKTILALKAYPKRATLTEWVSLWLERLHTFGWPGAKSLSSELYQIVQRFYNSLQQWQTELTAVVSKPLSIHDALQTLKQFLAQQCFQPETVATHPIQVLGMLEAASLEFDALWCCGLNANTLPQSVQLNACIPFEVQRQARLPRATSEHELTVAHDLIAYWVSHSHHCVLSYAQHSEGTVQLPSPLLANYGPACDYIDGAQGPTVISETENISQVPQLSFAFEGETAQDNRAQNYGPPLSAQYETPRVTPSILGEQALCAFRGFARQRLKVRDFDQCTPWFDSRAKGALLHQVLEQLWQKWQQQSVLLQLSEVALAEQLNDVIQITLKRFAARQAWPVKNITITLEAVRLQRLLIQWLDLEKQRSDFKVIGIEQVVRGYLGTLCVEGRIDRIDQLNDGSTWVIDYKTGSVQLSRVTKTPLSDPQLPLYAQLFGAQGFGWACIQAPEQKLMGLCSEPTHTKGMITVTEARDLPAEVTDWQHANLFWNQQLQQLADDMLAGLATVAPTTATACDFCDLQRLCRISEVV